MSLASQRTALRRPDRGRRAFRPVRIAPPAAALAGDVCAEIAAGGSSQVQTGGRAP